mmetsp:Transcript_19248/g.40530  ORF Transcript_19248/g.40530 Transcript_19248/m.40530 type:complete len:110 (+) Transcript_19248:2477-2806(+)
MYILAGNVLDAKTEYAHTQRSHVIIPGENMEGNLVRIPALMTAMNSATSCMVVLAISWRGATPGMQLDKRLSSFRSQQIGSKTAEGSVLAYEPNEEGVSASSGGCEFCT